MPTSRRFQLLGCQSAVGSSAAYFAVQYGELTRKIFTGSIRYFSSQTTSSSPGIPRIAKFLFSSNSGNWTFTCRWLTLERFRGISFTLRKFLRSLQPTRSLALNRTRVQGLFSIAMSKMTLSSRVLLCFSMTNGASDAREAKSCRTWKSSEPPASRFEKRATRPTDVSLIR